MALVAGEFYSGGRVVDKYGRDSLKAETAGSALSAGDYKSGGRVHDSDGRLVVVVETLNAALTPGSIKSGGRLFDDKGRLIVAVSGGGALSAGEVLSGGEVTDAQGRVVVLNQTLDTALGAGEYDSGGAARGSFGRRLVAGAGSSFDPTSIAGLFAWYKADAGTSTTTDGVAVSQWNDQSGNARHVTGPGGSQPTYKAAIQNGKPILRFNGSVFLDMASLVLPAAYSLFAVAKCDGGVAVQSLFDADNNTIRQFQFRFNTVLEMIAFNTVPSAFIDSQAITLAQFNQISGVVGATSVQSWVNGASDGSTASTGTPAAVTLAPRIGQHQAGGQGFVGDLGELLFYNSALNSTDRGNVENYLKGRWATP